MTIFGTRPEAIKLSPLIRAFGDDPRFHHHCCVTGQHQDLLAPVLSAFDIVPDFDLALMKGNNGLTDLFAASVAGISTVLQQVKPDRVVVQGDTNSALAASLAAFYSKVPVAHVEAGLRTRDIGAPWPEEMNRRLISQIAVLHFAPTQAAAANLRLEGVAESAICVSGNTVIDALHGAVARLEADRHLRAAAERQFAFLDPAKRLILVTAHRRENIGPGIEAICAGLRRLTKRGDVEIVYPLHPNPQARGPVQALLGRQPGIHLIEPLDYFPFVHLMTRSYLIITDSGGIQEEAPTLGKPVLVTRALTERPEAEDVGAIRTIGTGADSLYERAGELLDNPVLYAAMAQMRSPFGDGRAAARITERLLI